MDTNNNAKKMCLEKSDIKQVYIENEIPENVIKIFIIPGSSNVTKYVLKKYQEKLLINNKDIYVKCIIMDNNIPKSNILKDAYYNISYCNELHIVTEANGCIDDIAQCLYSFAELISRNILVVTKEIGNIENYIDYIEFPDADDLLDGVSDGFGFSHVSNTYLNGFINYVDIVDAYMIRYYKETEYDGRHKFNDPKDLSWEKSCELIDKESNDSQHFHFHHDSRKYDDMLILAKGCGSYWLFYDDCDGSLCTIGRFSESHLSINNAKEALYKAALERTIDYKDYEEKYRIKRLPLRLFNGWITL